MFLNTRGVLHKAIYVKYNLVLLELLELVAWRWPNKVVDEVCKVYCCESIATISCMKIALHNNRCSCITTMWMVDCYHSSDCRFVCTSYRTIVTSHLFIGACLPGYLFIICYGIVQLKKLIRHLSYMVN